jgi:hypothetical protein
MAVPLLAVIVLSAPAWLPLAFLSADRRNTVLDFLSLLVEWVRVVARTGQGWSESTRPGADTLLAEHRLSWPLCVPRMSSVAVTSSVAPLGFTREA